MGLPKRTALSSTRLPEFDAPASIFDLFNYVIFELFGVTGSLVTRICEADYGVTRDEWQVVAMLAASGSMAPSELSARTTIDASQMSRTLRQMCAKGLVNREAVAGDARRAIIVLTDAGRALYASLFPRAVDLNCRVLAPLSSAERRALADMLVRLRVHACDVVEATPVSAKVNRGKSGVMASHRSGR